MLVLFVGAFTVQQHIEDVTIVAAESKTTAVLNVFLGSEMHREGHGKVGVRLTRSLVGVSLVKVVSQSESFLFPGGFYDSTRDDHNFSTDDCRVRLG